MKLDKLNKSQVAEPAKIEATRPQEELIKANTDIITDNSNKESLKQVLTDLETKFMLGNIYLFLDLDINKYVIINYNSIDKFDTLKAYDKQSVGHLIKSILTTRIRANEVEPFEFNKSNIAKLINSIQGVKKSFDKFKPEFFTDTDYLPTLNLFKRTALLSYEITTKINYQELYSKLISNYKRLYLLLQNNIGEDNSIEWFLNWVSMEINQPQDIKTTFIIIGEQGSGKSILAEEIFKENIYHFSNVSILDNKTIKDNFNDIYNYKSFIIMNEVSTMDLKENNQIAQDLKRLITDGSYINRGMFKSGVEKQKTFNIAFTTNKNEPVQIENGDRRFSVFGRGKKLLELESVDNLLKENNEDFDSFIINVKVEIREFLYLVKSLKYDKNVAIQPIMTELKKKIIAKTNTKEDLMKSYFNTRKYEELESLLKQFDFDNEERFYTQFKKMWDSGIFSNTILFEIYVAVYEVEINDFNLKSQQKKAGSFWSKILHKPSKAQMKINNEVVSFKVFDELNIEAKKDNFKRIITGQELVITYENISIEEDEEIPF